MKAIQERLIEKEVKVQLLDLWRDSTSMYSAYDQQSGKRCSVKVIQDQIEQTVFTQEFIESPSGNTILPKFSYYCGNNDNPTAPVIIVFDSPSKTSLRQFLKNTKDGCSPSMAAGFALDLLAFSAKLNSHGQIYFIADQIPDSLIFHENTIQILPLSISANDFKQHVHMRYATAIVEGKIFQYPPETLLYASDIKQEQNPERGESVDVWAIGVLMFLLLGGEYADVMKIINPAERYDILRGITSLHRKIRQLFKRIFVDSPIERITLKELEKELGFIKENSNSDGDKDEDDQNEKQIVQEDGQYQINQIQISEVFKFIAKERLLISSIEEEFSELEEDGKVDKEEKIVKVDEETKEHKEKTKNKAAELNLLMSGSNEANSFSWKLIWEKYIVDNLLNKLCSKTEKMILFLAIKLCFDRIVKVIYDSHRDSDVEKDFNSDLKELQGFYQRSLLTPSISSVGQFLNCAGDLLARDTINCNQLLVDDLFSARDVCSRYYFNLAKQQEDQGASLIEIEESYRSCLGINANHNEAAQCLTQILQKLKDSEIAAQKFQHQIESCSQDDVGSYISLAKQLKLQGKISESIAALELCIQVIPNIELVYDKLIELIEIQGDTDKLKNTLEQYDSAFISTILNSSYMVQGKKEMTDIRIEEATNCFDEALKKWPRSAELKYQIAVIYYRECQNMDEALKLTKSAISMVNYHPEYQFFLAKIYLFSFKKTDLAIQALQELVAHSPTHATGLLYLGRIYLNHKKDYKNSLKYLKQSLRVCDRQSEIYADLGLVYYKLGNMRYALACLEVNRRIEGYNEIIEFTYGKVLFYCNQTQNACDVLNKFLKKRDFIKRPSLFFYMGLCFQSLGKKSQGFYQQSSIDLMKERSKIIAIKKSLELMLNNQNEKGFIEYLKNLGSFTQKQTDPDLCALLCKVQRRIGLHYLSTMHYVEQGLQESLFREGEEGGMEVLSRKLSFDVAAGCLVQEAKIQFLMGRNIDGVLEKVEELRKMILERKTKLTEESQVNLNTNSCQDQRKLKKATLYVSDWSFDVELLLAEIYHSQKRFDDASVILQNILANKSTQLAIKFEAAHLKALCLLGKGKELEGLAALRDNEKYNPSLFKLWVYLFEIKDFPQAKIKFNQLITNCEKNHEYIRVFSNLEFSIKNYDIAFELYKQYYELVNQENNVLKELDLTRRKDLPSRQIPFDAESIGNLGYCYLEKNDIPKAFEMLNISLKLNQNSPNVLQWLVKAYIQMKNYLKAEKYLKRLIKISEKAETYYLLGVCRQHFKDKVTAKDYFENAVKLDKSHFLALRGLGLIFLEENDYQLSAEYLKKCKQTDKSDEITLLGLIKCKWKRDNKPEKAEVCIMSMLNLTYATEQSIIALLLFYRETKQLPQHSFIVSRSQLYINSIEALFHLGGLFYEQSNIDAKNLKIAQDFFLKLIGLPKSTYLHEYSVAYLRVAQISFTDKAYKKALEYLNKVNFKDIDEQRLEYKQKGETQSYVFMGKLLETKIRFQQNMPHVDKLLFQCIKLAPQSEQSYLYLSYYMAKKESYRNAWKFLSKVKPEQQQLEATSQIQDPLKSELFLFLQAVKEVQTGNIDNGIKLLKQCIFYCQASQISSFYLGNIRMNAENYIEAINNYKNCLVQTAQSTTIPLSVKESTECLCQLAVACRKINNNQEALLYIQKCLDFDPGNAVALRIKASINSSQGNSSKAYQSILDSVKYDNYNPESYDMLATISLKFGNTFSAIKALQQCSSLNSNFPMVEMKLAAIYESIRRPQVALIHLLQHLGKNPESKQALLRASKILVYYKKYDAAKSHIDRLFKLLQGGQNENIPGRIIVTKDNHIPSKQLTVLEDNRLFDEEIINIGDAHAVLGYFYKQLGNFPQAISCYQEALRINPNNEEVLFSLANIYSELGNYTEEINCYSQLIKNTTSKRQQKDYCINLGNAQMKSKHFKEAIKQYEKASFEELDSPGVFVNLGACRIFQGKYDSALKYLERAQSITHGQSETYFLSGLVHQKKGDTMNAIKSFEKSILLDQGYVPGYLSLAQMKITSGKLSEAIQLCQVCLQFSPQDLRVQIFLGDSQLKAGDYWSALAMFEQILGQIQGRLEKTKANKEIQIKCNLQKARILMQLKEPQNAVIHLRDCLKQDQDHPGYLYELGCILTQKRKTLKDGLDLLKQASNDCPDNPIYMFSIADALHKLERYELEIEVLRNCLAMVIQPFKAQVYNNLGLAYESLKQSDKAIEVFKEGILCCAEGFQLQFNLGNILFQQKNFKEAAEAYEKCILQDSNHIGALHNLANVSLYLRDFQRSADCFNKCLIINPKKHSFYTQKMVVLLKKGYYPCQI